MVLRIDHDYDTETDWNLDVQTFCFESQPLNFKTRRKVTWNACF